MKPGKSAFLKYVLSALVAGVLLYFSFRGVKWADFIEAVRACRPGWLLAAMSAGVASFLVRALRWSQIVRPTDDSVKLRDSFNAVNISYLVNLALPRAGELVRCGYLARHCRRAGYDRLLGTVVLERVWDILMMFGLVVLLAWAMWDRFGSFFVEKMLTQTPSPAPKFTIDPQVRDFYAFTRESFSLEGYTPAPFTDTIPIAI